MMGTWMTMKMKLCPRADWKTLSWAMRTKLPRPMKVFDMPFHRRVT